jgi:GWxTD domain-containing protein
MNLYGRLFLQGKALFLFVTDVSNDVYFKKSVKSMKRIAIVFFIFSCVLSVTSARAQQGPVEMDAVAFSRDSGKTQVEIYYTIVEGALPYENTGNRWVIPIHGRAELWDGQKVAASQEFAKEKVITGSQADYDASKFSLIMDGIVLAAHMNVNGTAALILYVKKSNGEILSDTIKRSFVLPASSKDKFAFGGLELAGSLQATSDRTNPFEKVGYIITPNPSKLFGVKNTKLNYYSELYIPASSISASAECEIVARVIDGARHEMFTSSRKQALSSGSIPLIGSLDIDGLPSDSYQLEISAKSDGKVVAVTQKEFFFDDGMKLSEDQSSPQSGGAISEDAIFASSDLSTIPELELQEKGTQAMYIGTTAQQKDWKRLMKITEAAAENSPEKAKNIAEERHFLFAFWRSKDKDRGSMQPLSVYSAYNRQVDEVNKKFTYQKTPGWKTDFGRVYLTYSAPQERYIKKVLHSIDSRPYIIWDYYDKSLTLTSGSNATFVFVDKQGGGKFELVHSNVQGEVYEPDWQTVEAKRTN